MMVRDNACVVTQLKKLFCKLILFKIIFLHSVNLFI